MPNFPRHSSGASLTTQQPRAFRNDADFRNDAAVNNKIASTAISAIQDTAVKWNDALVTSQVNAFKAQKGIFMADVKSRATLDPDQNAADKYLKEVEDYNKNALKGMSEMAKREAGAELFSDTEIAKIQINGVFQKKIIAESAKNLTTSLDGYRKEILNTGSPAEMGKSYTAAYKQIDTNVATNIISPDEGKRLKTKFDEDVRTGLIDRDLYSNPKGFKQNVKDYEFKDEKERSDKIAKADGLIQAEKKKVEWEEKQINTLGAYDLSNAMLSKSITHGMIKDMYNKGMIDSNTAAIFDEIVVNKAFEIPPDTKTGKPDFFLRLLDEVGDDKTEALDILKHAAKAYGSGGMGANQYAYFVNEANERFNREKKGESWGDKLYQGTVKGLKAWSKNINEDDAFMVKLLKSFLDKAQSGESIEGAAQSAKSEIAVGLDPSLANVPKDGELRWDKYGRKAIVYPDGTYKEVE